MKHICNILHHKIINIEREIWTQNMQVLVGVHINCYRPQLMRSSCVVLYFCIAVCRLMSVRPMFECLSNLRLLLNAFVALSLLVPSNYTYFDDKTLQFHDICSTNSDEQLLYTLWYQRGHAVKTLMAIALWFARFTKNNFQQHHNAIYWVPCELLSQYRSNRYYAV